MSLAVWDSTADAMVAELNAATTFSVPFASARVDDPDLDLEDVGILHVDVMPDVLPPAVEISASTASGCNVVCNINVAVRKRFGTTDQDATTGKVDQAEVDSLKLLVQEIHDFFKLRRLTAYTEAVWTGTKIPLLWSPKRIRTQRQFTAVLTFTFMVYQ